MHPRLWRAPAGARAAGARAGPGVAGAGAGPTAPGASVAGGGAADEARAWTSSAPTAAGPSRPVGGPCESPRGMGRDVAEACWPWHQRGCTRWSICLWTLGRMLQLVEPRCFAPSMTRSGHNAGRSPKRGTIASAEAAGLGQGRGEERPRGADTQIIRRLEDTTYFDA